MSIDEEFEAEFDVAEAEARAMAEELAAEPVSKRQFRQLHPLPAAIQGLGKQIYSIELRDLLAVGFAASGSPPEQVYEDADEALALREIKSVREDDRKISGTVKRGPWTPDIS